LNSEDPAKECISFLSRCNFLMVPLQLDELSRGPIHHILQAVKRLGPHRYSCGCGTYTLWCNHCGRLASSTDVSSLSTGRKCSDALHVKSDDAKLFQKLKAIQGLSPSLQIMLQEMGVVFERTVA